MTAKSERQPVGLGVRLRVPPPLNQVPPVRVRYYDREAGNGTSLLPRTAILTDKATPKAGLVLGYGL